MCTVTYVPTQGGFIFTTNRDEDPKRSANRIVEDERGGSRVYFPQDEGAHGSWIAYSNNDQFVCILNGAFEPHQRKAKYTMSRGMMALAFFDYTDVESFLTVFNFEGMEPFTMILYHQGDFRELKWDESDLHVRKLSTTAVHLWSSATLYTHDWWVDRSVGFQEYISRQAPDQVGIMHYHKTELAFSIKALQERLNTTAPLTNVPVKTTSVSSIEKNEKGYSFQFHRTDDRLKLSTTTY